MFILMGLQTDIVGELKMVVNADDDAAQNYQNNTDGSNWLSEFNAADLDGSEWTDGLDDAGVENTDEIDGDSVWASQVSADEQDASEYDAETTAEAWAEGWGDASTWDV